MLIAIHDGEDAARYREQVLQVWTAAFGPVPDEADWASDVFDRHRQRDDYRLATALDDSPGGRLLGFAWGYTGRRGQFWTDLVADTLGDAAEPWVGGHFEFVELAVTPQGRGRGLGRALHDATLQELPHDRALLGTSSDPDDPAVRLYRSAGWRRLGLLAAETQVMGLRLGARSPGRVTRIG